MNLSSNPSYPLLDSSNLAYVHVIVDGHGVGIIYKDEPNNIENQLLVHINKRRK